MNYDWVLQQEYPDWGVILNEVSDKDRALELIDEFDSQPQGWGTLGEALWFFQCDTLKESIQAEIYCLLEEQEKNLLASFEEDEEDY